MTADTKLEVERQRKTADMLVSCHARLRDQFAFHARVIDLFLLLASLLIVSLTFAADDVLEWLPISSRLGIGILAIGVTFGSLAAALLDWKASSARHDRAAQAYAAAKSALTLVGDSSTSDEVARALELYEEAGRYSVPIPEGSFARLKSEHRIKLLISRMLDKNPAAPVWLMRLRLRWGHSRRFWKAEEPEI